MGGTATYDHFDHAFFITFSCYKRRRILDDDSAKRVVIGVLSSQLGKQHGDCAGFVVMPDHVHAVVHFQEPDQLSHFMKQWKQRSSVNIKRNLKENKIKYLGEDWLADPIWQAGYYSFKLHGHDKFLEKINYMHANPVKAGLVSRPEEGKSVGIKIVMPA